MSESRKPAALILAAAGALAMVAIILIGSVWFLQLPFIAKHLPSFEEPVAESTPDDAAEPAAEPPASAGIGGASAEVDCEELAENLTYRLQSARGCVDDLQCGLSVPQQRCMIGLSIGLRAPLEDAVLQYAAHCEEPLAELGKLCRVPDREWEAVCRNNQCELREANSPWDNP